MPITKGLPTDIGQDAAHWIVRDIHISYDNDGVGMIEIHLRGYKDALTISEKEWGRKVETFKGAAAQGIATMLLNKAETAVSKLPDWK